MAYIYIAFSSLYSIRADADEVVTDRGARPAFINVIEPGADGKLFTELIIRSENELFDLTLNVTNYLRPHFLISTFGSSLDIPLSLAFPYIQKAPV